MLPAGLSAQGVAALKLLEHIYAPNTQAQSLKVTVTPIKDRSGKVTDVVVDWGDGTPKSRCRATASRCATTPSILKPSAT